MSSGAGAGVRREASPGAVAAGRGGERWLAAARALDDWMRARDYAGYDPHDLLASPLVRRLTLGSRWLGVAWTQLGRRSPVQLRPLLGVPALRNAKGVGLVLAAHVRLARVTGEARYGESAGALVGWLGEHVAPGVPGAGWGYPFPWANRDFYAPAGTPSGVATSFIGHALLDAAAALGSDEASGLAVRAGEFLRHALNRIPGRDGTFCFSYTPRDHRGVHNANVLAASLLARLAADRGDGAAAEDALRAARFSVAAQRADGSWPYGIGARNGWVDSFHTGYTLVALHEVGQHLDTAEFDDAIARGLDHWRRAFLHGPAVGFYANAPYPIDLHAVAHAILMLLTLRARVPDALPTAARVADWSLREMRDPAGYFHYRLHRTIRNRLPYMRWIQAWMLRALAELAATAAP